MHSTTSSHRIRGVILLIVAGSLTWNSGLAVILINAKPQNKNIHLKDLREIFCSKKKSYDYDSTTIGSHIQEVHSTLLPPPQFSKADSG
jgi:hypothetical protein